MFFFCEKNHFQLFALLSHQQSICYPMLHSLYSIHRVFLFTYFK